MKKILMLVTNDVYNDTRVQKEAKSLASAGYEVVIFGKWQKRGKPKEKIDNYTVYRYTHYQGLKSFYEINVKRNIRKIFLYQLLNKLDRKLTKKIKRKDEVCENGFFDKVNTEKDRKEIIRTKELNEVFYNIGLKYNPDVCHCHDLDTLHAGYLLKQRIGCKLIYDAHELFTEQQFPRSEEWTLYFQKLEKELINSVDIVITVNNSIVEELKRRYLINKVTYIYNSPFYKEIFLNSNFYLRKIADERKIVLFHGGYIIDRGLEQLILSSKYLKNAIIVFRGYGPLENKLKNLVKKEKVDDKIFFDVPVKMDELIQSASNADIGIIPYIPTCLNNKLCTPNKLFEYMMAGLAIIGSNLPELRRIILEENVGLIIEDPNNPEEIAEKINQLATDEKKLQEFKNNSLKSAKNKYNWEIEEKKLLAIYKEILKN